MNFNIYHRYITLPFTLHKPKCFDSALEHHFLKYVSPEELPDDLFKWTAQHNIKISNVIEGFYTKPNGGAIPIHNDTVIPPGVRDACKLNFTWGPETSTTRWYKLKPDSQYIEVNHDATEANKSFQEAGIEPDIDCYKCYTADKNDIELIHEAVINRPSLMNVGQLHNTHNPDPIQDRWTLSLTLLTLPGDHLSFEEALIKFKDIIDHE
jgi:hypothetical protein